MSGDRNELFANWNWQPPASWIKVTTIDMHTGGEPLRVLVSGVPPLQGRTVLEKRRYFRENYDYIRTGIMREPRGHLDMYGSVLSPSEDADFDVFFLHNEGYSTMCGHAILALTKLAFETGLVAIRSENPELKINVPAGMIHARARLKNGNVESSSFQNVPSFLHLREKTVDVPGLGVVHFDVAYGGAFYAIVEAEPLGLKVTPENVTSIVDIGLRIKHAVMEQFPIKHPFEEDLSFLYGTIFTAPALVSGHHSRNVCVFADGQVDRSATGSGVSARAALHRAKGELRIGEAITIESILGSTMTVRVVKETSFGTYEAVIPEVSGTAYITGCNEFYFDPNDPFRQGFLLGRTT